MTYDLMINRWYYSKARLIYLDLGRREEHKQKLKNLETVVPSKQVDNMDRGCE